MEQDEPSRGPVRRDSLLGDVLETRPDAARVLFETWKLPCYDCEVAFHETVEQGASYYGIDPDEMVRRLEACPLGPEPVEDEETDEDETEAAPR